MKLPTVLVLPAALVGLLGMAAPAFAQCEPDGQVQFVCGPMSPEDLVQIPGSPWVIVSTWEPDGYLSAAHSGDHRTMRLFPTEMSRPRHDTAMYGACPGMTTDRFQSHGVSLRPGSGGLHTLYVVRHGDREAVEVFEVDAHSATPSLTWIGCVIAPEGTGLNAVVALPGGGIAVTSPRTSDLWEWQAGTGWARVPGSENIGPNGLEISADGQWFYVAGYGSQSLIRLSRSRTPVQTDAVEVGFNIDNVHWAADGTLLPAGHTGPPGRVGACIGRRGCDGIVSYVAKVTPDLSSVREIFNYPTNEYLPVGTVAIQVGNEIWVGGVAGGERIARIRAP